MADTGYKDTTATVRLRPSLLSCVGAVKGTQILNPNGFKRIIQTQPTLQVGVNLVPDLQNRSEGTWETALAN